MLNPAYLSIPEKQSRSEVIVSNKPKPLQKWLAELPKDNDGMTTRLLFDRILEINKTKFEAQHLNDVLNQLLPFYSIVHRFLNSRLRTKGVPISPDQQKIADLSLNMSKEFARCYFYLLNLFASTKRGWRFNKRLSNIVGQLIHSYAEILVTHYILHLEEPDWVWFDINALYKHATKHKLLNLKFKNPRLSLDNSATVRQAFMRINVLRISGPYHLSQTEILNLSTLLEKWVPLTQTSAVRVESQDNGPDWLVNLDEDKPPMLGSKSASPQTGENYFWINLQPLLKLIRDHLDLADSKTERFDYCSLDGKVGSTIPLYLLKYIERRWTGLVPGDLANFADRHEQLLSIGFKNTHQQFDNTSFADQTITGDWLASRVSEHQLSCMFHQTQQIAIGCLVGYRSTIDESAARNLGIVNQIVRTKNTEPIRFQIAKLEGRIYPAGIRPVQSDKQTSVYQRALMYVENFPTGSKTVLLVDTKHLSNGQIISVLVQKKFYTVELSNRKIVALNCFRFECQRVDLDGEIPSQGFDFL